MKNIFIQKMWGCMLVLFLAGFSLDMNAQCDVPAVSSDLATNPLVHISLDGDCEAAIHPDQILEGDFDCYDHFEVLLTSNGAPAIVGAGDVGETISVTVNLLNENDEVLSTGWGNVLVEDKVDPEIFCPCEEDPAACEFTCEDLEGILDGSIDGPQATATDACIEVEVTYVDAITYDGGDCGTTIVTRTFTATDGSGNTSTCEADLSFRILTFEDVEDSLPADLTFDDALECGDDVPASIEVIRCNISISLESENRVDVCEGTYKLLRNYVLIDWCADAPYNVTHYTQTIKVLDTQGPELTCADDFTIGTVSNACEGNTSLPIPTYTDCGGGVTLTPSATSGSLHYGGGAWTISGLELGTHTITWTAEDDCGNVSDCSYDITVEDNIAPIAVCDLHTKVGLGTDGDETLVSAITFDDGSLDNCGIVEYKVRRMDNPSCPGFDATGFDDYVPFYCCDLGSTVMVELRVVDAAGNSNSCMVEVEVEDKINPTIYCPTNKIVECIDETAPEATGFATATDNCGNPEVTYYDNGGVDDCGIGTIFRIWTATDGAGRTASCVQRIDVINSDPFTITDTECRTYPLGAAHSYSDDVEWPCDIEIGTCGLGLEPADLELNGNTNPITGQAISLDARPTVIETSCNNVAITKQDTELDFGADDACLKILRKWIIIDWCTVENSEYNGPNPDPTDPSTDGVWHYTQVIKVVNSSAPVIGSFNGPAEVENFDSGCGSAYAAFNITASDDCTDFNNLDITWAFSTGTTGHGTSASGSFANGDYSITFTVNDGCDNETSQTKYFTVFDAKKPTPVCIFGIASVIMPSSGAVTIWASDFESGSSYDNCTDYEYLEFSFSPDVDDKYLDIQCSDIPADGLLPVTLYVTDAYGNYDFCTTFISVQDPNGACSTPTALISGAIQNELGEDVEEVTVKLEDGSGMLNTIVTDVDGAFAFNGMTNGSYDVTPEKNHNFLNGVTTYDLVLISKHILGSEVFDTPYKWIAADANKSGTVTTLDIVKLRALILHIDDELSNNTSWRFVDQDFTFAAGSPLTQAFPEYKDVQMTGSTIPANFVAVKIGDVNGTSSVNSLLGTDTRNFNGNLALQLDATKVAAGETFTVDFRANDFNNIAGYQFTLGFDNNKVDFVDVKTNLEGLTANNFGLTKLNEGVITTSWNATKGVSVDNDAVLFTMTFLANASVDTEELFEINSRYAASEAYAGSDLYNVVLEFNGATASNGFELYQNTPNPFTAETQIGFNMPEAGAVSLTIYDVSGRVLRLMEMDAAKGFNSINVERAGLNATGVLYYQLETATETATKKMIIVD